MKVFFATVIILMGLVTNTLAHPAEGLEAIEDSSSYNHYIGDSGWDNGELKFFSLEQRLPYDGLSNIEKYMCNGARDEEGKAYMCYWLRVTTMVDEYFGQFGSLPEVLDADAIRSLENRDNMTDSQLDWFRNPITGQWPRVGNTEQLPGNIYMQPLSTAEKAYLSQFNEAWKMAWYDNKKFSMELFNKGYPKEECYVDVPPVNSEIWYFRMYGENGVLMAGITYGRISD